MAYETQLHLIGERHGRSYCGDCSDRMFLSCGVNNKWMELHHLLQMTFLEHPPSGLWRFCVKS